MPNYLKNGGIDHAYGHCISEDRADDVIVDFVKGSEPPYLNEGMGKQKTIAIIVLGIFMHKHSDCSTPEAN